MAPCACKYISAGQLGGFYTGTLSQALCNLLNVFKHSNTLYYFDPIYTFPAKLFHIALQAIFSRAIEHFFQSKA